MSNIAYPYPNLMPWVRGNSLWEYSLNKGDFFDFKNGVDNWDYYSSIEIKCKLIWDIKEAFKNANLDTNLNFFRETNNKRKVSHYIYKTLH